nr:ADP-ribosyltransferase [Nocardia bovistercoris]
MFDAAAAFFAAVDAEWPELAKAAEMAGSYAEAQTWADIYDRQAQETLDLVSRTANAVHNYGTILLESGYQHALADHTANLDPGPEPTKPAAPQIPVFVCRVPLPAAGGPGNGLSGDQSSLVRDALGLADKIGITIPDGDATKMSNAAAVWERMAAAGAVAGLVGTLEAAARAFDDVTAAESAFIDEDLRAAAAAAAAVVAAMLELAASTREHRADLDGLRTQLVDHLTSIANALMAELAINAAVSVASSWVTFGVSIAAGIAAAAAIAARYARPIRATIEAWRTARRAKNTARASANTLANHAKEMRRLEELGGSAKTPTPTAARPLTEADKNALADYSAYGSRLNNAMREGRITEEQQGRINELNSALDKLPNHEGLVVRRTALPDDVLAQYQKGTNVSDPAFTSASTGSGFTGPVEFQIMSRTGKDISGQVPTAYAPEAEVLFKSGTNFNVVDRFVTADGRTIIQMTES